VFSQIWHVAKFSNFIDDPRARLIARFAAELSSSFAPEASTVPRFSQCHALRLSGKTGFFANGVTGAQCEVAAIKDAKSIPRSFAQSARTRDPLIVVIANSPKN
jgi:hypothetical protein